VEGGASCEIVEETIDLAVEVVEFCFDDEVDCVDCVMVTFSATRVAEIDVVVEAEVGLTFKEDSFNETLSIVSTLIVGRRGGRGGGITGRFRGGKGGGLVSDRTGPVNVSSIKSWGIYCD
jgi:hypothetical protein